MVKDWPRFQRYNKTRPPWIKNYTNLNRDRCFLTLHPYCQALAQWIWRETARYDAWLVFDPRSIGRKYLSEFELGQYKVLSRDLRRHLTTLIERGYLIVVDSPVPKPSELIAAKEEKGTRTTASPPKNGEMSLAFKAFFFAFPPEAQIDMEGAWRAWGDRHDRPADKDIVAAVKAQARSARWQRDQGRYIPSPTNWIKNGRWTDSTADAEPEGGWV